MTYQPADRANRGVRVCAPATSANLGPGFDALGLALQWYDEVEVWTTGMSGVDVVTTGAGADEVDSGEDHLVVRAVGEAFGYLGAAVPGMRVRCRNRVPHGRGLGSSAAAIVSGVLAGRELARQLAVPRAGQFDDEDVYQLAVALEGHPDNVAACLGGGLAVAWRGAAGERFVRLEPAESLETVAYVPDTSLSTRQARAMLPSQVAHGDAAFTAGRAALLVTALTQQPSLLFEATEDRLHQPFRAEAAPETAELLAKLRSGGTAAVVSGAGPTLLVLAQRQFPDSIGTEAGSGWLVRALTVDRAGARVRVLGSRHAHDAGGE